MVSVIRGDDNFDSANAAPTTAQILSATAGASAGAVGTYSFLVYQGSVANGTAVAASSLQWAGTGDPSSYNPRATNTSGYASGASTYWQLPQLAGSTVPTGTWMCVGGTGGASSTGTVATLYLRIA